MEIEIIEEEYLSEWLVSNGYAEEKTGYGHVSAENLAAALIAEFSISEK